MYPLMACLRPSGVIGASKTVIGASDLLGSLRNLLGSRTAPRLRNPSSGAYPSDPSGVIGASKTKTSFTGQPSKTVDAE
jgi:hypothetical protein